MKRLRPYQKAASDAGVAYLTDASRLGGLIVMPTGSGKSLVMADLIKRLYTSGYMKILVLAHKRELIRQNEAEAIEHIRNMRLKPSIGVYCAGLKRKDVHADVVFATIQSVYRRADEFVPVDLVIIDEAHLVSRTQTTTYREFLNGLNIGYQAPVLGLTATPWRLEGSKTNPLCGGKTALFEDIVHEVDADMLVEQGYLAPIVTAHGIQGYDVTGIPVARGDFVQGAVEDAVTVPAIVRQNVDETIRHGADRRCWLVFCSGVKHAHVVRAAFLERGFDIPVVTGDTDEAERDDVLNALKTGAIQGCINVEVATTGFDARPVDLIGFMRPTQSKGLFLQAIGRGMRLFEGKENCIAEGQRVLTDSGLIPIENVKTWMKVWDGVAFVEHAGAICKGKREVIRYAGLEATPDHKVYTKEGWKTFGVCAAEQIAIAVTGIGRKEVRATDGRADHRAILPPIAQTKRRVWDILEAGPRHSFTVEGLLVHNCKLLDFGGNLERLGTAFSLPFRIGWDTEPEEWTCESIIHAGFPVREGCGTINPIHRRLCEGCGMARPSGSGPMKQCNECEAHCSTSCRECPQCGALFLSLDGCPSNIAWRESMGINVDGTVGLQFRDIRNMRFMPKTTSKGSDMLLVGIDFADRTSQFCVYFPAAERGPPKRQFELLHSLLSSNEGTPLPPDAATAAQYIRSGQWRKPKSVVLDKDRRNYVYVVAVI